VFHHTDDGQLRLSVELDADEGARLLAAFELARLDGSAETPRTFDGSAETPRTRADALMVLVESFLAEGARFRTGGTPTEFRLHVTEDGVPRRRWIHRERRVRRHFRGDAAAPRL